MSETWRNLSANLATFIAPGLVLLLLGIQVAFGLRGFDRPDDSLLYVLQVPGVLLGWGGVALLLPLLAWMILDWWGYDLNGFALKGLGSAALGIAVGSLFGLSGGVSTGGLVGGALATVLMQSVGPVLAWVLLLLMAIPACVLALSLQRGGRPVARTAGGAAPASAAASASARAKGSAKRSLGRPAVPPTHVVSRGGTFLRAVGSLFGRGAPKGKEDSAWYPQPRYDASGNELPMDFGRSRDVGGIRFVDEEEDTPTEQSSAAEDGPPRTAREGEVEEEEERLPTIPELLAGNFRGSRTGSALGGSGGGGFGGRPADPSGGPREAGEESPDEGPIHVDGSGRPTPGWAARPPVAPAAASAGAQAPLSASTPSPDAASPDASSPTPTAASRALAREQGLPFFPPKPPVAPREQALAPGVRYADEPAEAPEEGERGARAGAAEKTQTPSPSQQLSQAVQDAVRGPAANAAQDGVGQQSARTIRKTLRQSVAALQNEGTSERHLEKLEAMGLFDMLEAPPEGEVSPGGQAPATSSSKSNPKSNPSSSGGTPPGGTKTAAPKTAAPKTAARKKSARKASSRKATSQKATSQKAGPQKSGPKGSASPKPAPEKPAAGEPPASGVPESDAPQARAHTPHRKRTLKMAVAERQLMLEGLRIERLDPLFRRAVEAAFERGVVSPVLLTRRLGVPFARAQALIERMVSAGVLREAEDGSVHPLALGREEWDALRKS